MRRWVCFVLLLLLPLKVDACVLRFEPAAELKQKATLVWTVEVLSRQISERSVAGELYLYRVRVLAGERGPAHEGLTSVQYYNHRAHKRKDVIACPLKEGSGLETKLVVHSKYRLFLKSPDEKAILFSELLEE